MIAGSIYSELIKKLLLKIIGKIKSSPWLHGNYGIEANTSIAYTSKASILELLW